MILWIDDSLGLQSYWREHKLINKEYKNIQEFVPSEKEKLNLFCCCQIFLVQMRQQRTNISKT